MPLAAGRGLRRRERVWEAHFRRSERCVQGFGALGRERTGAGEGFSEASRLAWGMGGGLEGGREERTVGQENGSVTSNKSLAFYRSLQYLQSRDGGTFRTE